MLAVFVGERVLEEVPDPVIVRLLVEVTLGVFDDVIEVV